MESDIYMCGGFSVCVGYLPPSPLLPSLFKFHKIDFRKNKKNKIKIENPKILPIPPTYPPININGSSLCNVYIYPIINQ